MHLVGHSYGGVVALLAAAQRPGMVRSLTVNEPPAFGLLPDDPIVRDYARGLRELWDRGPTDPTAFLHAFIGYVGYVGSAVTPPDPLPPALLQNAQVLRYERLTDEARIPVSALREAPFPKLVVSGGHSQVFDAVCDVLERELEAQRAVVPGAGHSVQRTGAPYNEVLHRFLAAAR